MQKLHSNWMKIKTFTILEICTFRSLSVKFISETVKDRGNPSTFCRSSQYNSFNNNKITSKLEEK
jgi:hypothetical protein